MAEEKKKGMTVFKSDRHEDWASIVAAGLVVIAVLSYMAFFVSSVPFKAPSDGKILAVKVTENSIVKKGDTLLTMEIKEKKVVQGVTEEKVVQKDIKAKINGKVVKVAKKEGDTVKKKKDVLMVLEPERGQLP
ncbi:MAG: biotin/lipoyl-binding protein [Nitrospirota bacterium]